MWCLLINYYAINGGIMIITTNSSNNIAHYIMKYFVYNSILLVITEKQLQHITTHVCCSRSAVFEWVDITSSVACTVFYQKPLHWHHNERDGVSNHLRIDCLFNRLFRRRSKKISKLGVTGPCEGNSPVTGEFPAQRASGTGNVSIWWRHHDIARQCQYTNVADYG